MQLSRAASLRGMHDEAIVLRLRRTDETETNEQPDDPDGRRSGNGDGGCRFERHQEGGQRKRQMEKWNRLVHPPADRSFSFLCREIKISSSIDCQNTVFVID